MATDLDELVQKSLTVEDPEELEDILAEIQARANGERKETGLPPVDAPHVLLATETVRHERAKIEDYRQYTELLVGAEPAEDEEESFTRGGFNKTNDYVQYRDAVLKLSDEFLPKNEDTEELIIYPPLYLRSCENGSVRLQLKESGDLVQLFRARGQPEAPVILILFATGPIIPAVRSGHFDRFREVLPRLYKLKDDNPTTLGAFANLFHDPDLDELSP